MPIYRKDRDYFRELLHGMENRLNERDTTEAFRQVILRLCDELRAAGQNAEEILKSAIHEVSR